MRLNEITTDAPKPVITNKDIDGVLDQCSKYLKIIKKDCKPFLNATNNLEELIYHNSDDEHNKFTKITVKSNREPRDSPRLEHDFMNMIIHRKGLNANRSNSIFVTGLSGINYEYGRYSYAFFPIGKFAFTWSNNMKDWSETLSARYYFGPMIDYNAMSEEIKEMMKDSLYTPSAIQYDYFSNLLNSLHGNDNSLMEAVHSENEIMIHPINLTGYMVSEPYAIVISLLDENRSKAIKYIINNKYLFNNNYNYSDI